MVRQLVSNLKYFVTTTIYRLFTNPNYTGNKYLTELD